MNNLETRLSEGLHDLAGNAPHDLDLDRIERRGRHTKTRTVLTRTGVTLGVAALVAAAVGVSAPGRTAPKHSVDATAVGPGATTKAAPKHTLDTTTKTTGRETLIRLAGYILAKHAPTGDATEVIRTTTDVGKAPTIGADLFADDGRYFYSDDPSGLGAQVRADNNSANGVFGREVAIAQYAANGGDLATAQQRMAVAALDPGKPYRILKTPPTPPSGLTKAQLKTWGATGVPTVILGGSDWSNSRDALLAGAGLPDVRAGVLRILSTVPDVTVTETTTDGKPTLTLTETDKGSVSTYVESIVIGAQDGIPVELHGADLSDPSVAVTVTYAINRVTLADVH